MVGAGALALGMATTSAMALDIQTISLTDGAGANVVGAVDPTPAPPATYTPFGLARQLAFTADSTVGDDLDDGRIVLNIAPSTGLFPNTNLSFNISLTGATFDGALNGTTLFTGCAAAPTGVQQEGAADGDTSARFNVAGLNGCTAGTPLILTVPIDADGTGDVSISVFVGTEADNTPIDGGTSTVTAISLVDAVTITTTADGTSPVAALGTAPYTTLTLDDIAGGAQDALLGTITIAYNGNRRIGSGLAIANTDLGDLDVELTGSTAGFASGTLLGTTVASTNTTAFTAGGISFLNNVDPAAGTTNVFLTDSTATPAVQIESSEYSVAYTATFDTGIGVNPITTGGTLAPITRAGTNVVFPWTAAPSVVETSGQNNFIRLSNIGSQQTGAVFLQVLSSTVTGGTTDAIVADADGIEVGGEIVWSSADLAGVLGDWGRGDVLVIMEELPANVTAERFIVRGDGNILSVGNAENTGSGSF